MSDIMGSADHFGSLRGRIAETSGTASKELQGRIGANLEPLENKPQVYSGSYEVDPQKSEQVLATKDKVMSDDLTVLGIYYYEVTNGTGGKTVTIGRD